MTVALTSRIAYFDIQDTLGDRQKSVLSGLGACSIPPTNTELSKMLNMPINALTPRVFELRGKGLVTEAGKRLCSITGRLCQTWRLVTRDEYESQGSQLDLF